MACCNILRIFKFLSVCAVVAVVNIFFTRSRGFLFVEGTVAGLTTGSIKISKAHRDCFPRSSMHECYEAKFTSPAFLPVHHELSSADTGNQRDLAALLAFKRAVVMDPLGALSSWNSESADICSWRGITCSPYSKRVISLELSSLGLSGTASQALGSLDRLQRLDLSNNHFIGNIPFSLANCSQLSYVALGDNSFTGQIPSQLGDLQQLQFLDLGRNVNLGGLLPIPASLGNCTKLKVLRLDYTVVAGEIPSSLGKLFLLEALNLTNTLNNGSIPKALANCSSLIYLAMGNLYNVDSGNIELHPDISIFPSELSGELPEELSQLKNLQGFGVGGTGIQGPFPMWTANLTRLRILGLEASYWRGPIPSFLGRLPLEGLALANNNFSGTIPLSLSNCSNLWFLDLGGNPGIIGNIPSSLAQLTGLGYLSLYGTALSGVIPSVLSNLTALRVINLFDNPFLDPQPVPSWVTSLTNLTALSLAHLHLTGEIPKAIGQCSKLWFLGLTDNLLEGPIPTSIGNLTALDYMSVSDNQLSGKLPAEFWYLSSLSDLEMFNNNLEGTLSATIGNLSLLQYVDLGSNHFTGDIPSQLGTLSNLSKLSLDSNSFQGIVPESLGNCTNMVWLDLSNNKLRRSIPATLGNLTALGRLALKGNRFSGQIPDHLMNCKELVHLDLSVNLLSGGIPQEIGRLVSIQRLYLHTNNLSAVIPQSLGYCKNLIELDLSYNTLRGQFPRDAFANMSSLNWLNLSHNRLVKLLPRNLNRLISVQNLDFSNNELSGFLPTELGACTALQYLDLSSNNLSGGIPPVLTMLDDLRYVNFSYNNLEGPIPTHGGIFSSESLTLKSFLGNPRLCGAILSKQCTAVASITSDSSCHGFDCARVRGGVICAGATVLLSILGLTGWCLRSCLKTSKVVHGERTTTTLKFAADLQLSKADLLAIISLPENVVGVGASGVVYKGVLDGGRMVAIKTLRKLRNDAMDPDDCHDYNQAELQIWREAHTLSQLKHRNILKVLGLFSTDSLRALIVEFMPMATLHFQLHEIEKCKLEWQARFDMAIGTAQGLLYLHYEFPEPLVHRDLKPSNIFLDAELNPKLGDFGISKVVDPSCGNGEATTSTVCGSIGYIPPEYAVTDRTSIHGDVFSYGIILLELMTRRHPVTLQIHHDNCPDPPPQREDEDLVEWVIRQSRESSVAPLDPMLLLGSNERQKEQMRLLLHVGLLCTQDDPQKRPGMQEVVTTLTHIKEGSSRLALLRSRTILELCDEKDMPPVCADASFKI